VEPWAATRWLALLPLALARLLATAIAIAIAVRGASGHAGTTAGRLTTDAIHFGPLERGGAADDTRSA
jgi:hypothetical protein